MNMTDREFRIAVAAALVGFFLCYFLIGSTGPARPPAPKMRVIATLPAQPATSQPPVQFNVPSVKVQARPQIENAASRKYLVGPFAAMAPARKDLFSGRYKVNADLTDLQ
jgi:hypothetical protein